MNATALGAWPRPAPVDKLACQPPGGPMQLIDLSREIYHKMPRILTHPPIIITPFGTHEEVREADGYKFSSATLSIAMGDHAGTHVDAPIHSHSAPGAKSIDEVPLATSSTAPACP